MGWGCEDGVPLGVWWAGAFISDLLFTTPTSVDKEATFLLISLRTKLIRHAGGAIDRW